MKFLLAVLGVLAVVVPVIAAYWLLPAEVATTWPVLALTFTPSVAVMIASLVFHGARPPLALPLPTSAASWLQGTIDRMGRPIAVRVLAARDRHRHRGSFFHPASNTIVLAADVHDEHTARAHATAAHELGHAVFYSKHPRLGALSMNARQAAGRCFDLGTGLLLSAALVGGAGFRIAALLGLLAAIVVQAAVVVDEAIASVIGLRLLAEQLHPSSCGIAKNHLRRALATYCAQLVAYMVALVAAPHLFARFPGGLLVGGPPLVGIGATVATVVAVTCVVASLSRLRAVVWPRKRGMFGMVFVLASFAWLPLLAALVCNRPGIPGWTVGLAVVPAWWLLAVPAHVIVARFGNFLARDLQMMPISYSAPTLRIRDVSAKELAKDEEPDGILERAWDYSFSLWIVPLAIAWLLA